MMHTLSEQEYRTLATLSFGGRLACFITKAIHNDLGEQVTLLDIARHVGMSMKLLVALKNDQIPPSQLHADMPAEIAHSLNITLDSLFDSAYRSSYQDFMKEQDMRFSIRLPAFQPVQ